MARNKKNSSIHSSLLAELHTLTDRIGTAEAGEDLRAVKKCVSHPPASNTFGRVVALTLAVLANLWKVDKTGRAEGKEECWTLRIRR